MYLFFLPSLFKGLRIFNLNINGLNNRNKQLQLVDFIKFHRIDILMLQEHNLRNKNLICEELSSICHVHINLSVNQKGGTAILFNRKLNYKFLNEEMSGDSRIISIKVIYYNNTLQFTNVYAPSGSNECERDDFFQKDLMFYLRGNTSNIFLGGDFNSVISKNDRSSSNVHISKGFSNLVKSLQIKDAWFIKNHDPQFTYVRQNYGSRLDRIYVKNLANCITSIKLIHTHLSDHSGVFMEIDLPKVPKVGK